MNWQPQNCHICLGQLSLLFLLPHHLLDVWCLCDLFCSWPLQTQRQKFFSTFLLFVPSQIQQGREKAHAPDLKQIKMKTKRHFDGIFKTIQKELSLKSQTLLLAQTWSMVSCGYLQPMNSMLARVCARQTSRSLGMSFLCFSIKLRRNLHWCWGSWGDCRASTSQFVSWAISEAILVVVWIYRDQLQRNADMCTKLRQNTVFTFLPRT